MIILRFPVATRKKDFAYSNKKKMLSNGVRCRGKPQNEDERSETG